MAKSPNAFRTISEAAAEVGVPAHALRFWETKFPFVQPVKRAGGRRFYRPQDIEALRAVRRRLHDEGLTIKGVQRLHKTGGVAAVLGPAAPPPEPDPGLSADDRLRALLGRLEAARARLDAVLHR